MNQEELTLKNYIPILISGYFNNTETTLQGVSNHIAVYKNLLIERQHELDYLLNLSLVEQNNLFQSYKDTNITNIEKSIHEKTVLNQTYDSIIDTFENLFKNDNTDDELKLFITKKINEEKCIEFEISTLAELKNISTNELYNTKLNNIKSSIVYLQTYISRLEIQKYFLAKIMQHT